MALYSIDYYGMMILLLELMLTKLLKLTSYFASYWSIYFCGSLLIFSISLLNAKPFPLIPPTIFPPLYTLQRPNKPLTSCSALTLSVGAIMIDDLNSVDNCSGSTNVRIVCYIHKGEAQIGAMMAEEQTRLAQSGPASSVFIFSGLLVESLC